MLDDLENLRGKDTDASLFLDELALDHEIDEEYVEPKVVEPQKRFLGMTPSQRLLIALILCLMVCLWGTTLMVLFEKIALF